MAELGRIAKNSGYLLVSGQIARLLTFLQALMLIRYLGPEKYGALTLALAVPAMFAFMTEMGLNSVMVRVIARESEREAQTFEEILPIKLFCSLLFVVVVLCFASLSAQYRGVIALLIVASLSMVVSMYSETVIAVARAHENFALESRLSVAKEVAQCLLVLGIVLSGRGALSVMIAGFATNLAASLYCFVWYRKRCRIKLVFHGLRIYREHLKRALPFAFLNLINPVFFQIVLVLLGQFSSYSSVGIFNAAYRMILVLYLFPTVLGRAIMPRLFASFHASIEGFKNVLESTLRVVVLIGVPTATGLYLVADRITTTLFSTQYSGSTILVRLLAGNVILYYVRSILSAGLYASDREIRATVIYGAGTVLNLLLGCLLIPRWDSLGAAVSVLVAEAALCSAYCVAVRRHFQLQMPWDAVVHAALGSALMGGVVLLLSQAHLVVQIVAGAVVYALMLMVQGEIQIKHLREVIVSGRASEKA